MFDHITGALYFASVDYYNWNSEFILIREPCYRALLLMNIYQIIGNTSVSSFPCASAHIKLNVTLVQSTLLVGDSGTIYISVYVPLCYAILRLYSSFAQSYSYPHLTIPPQLAQGQSGHGWRAVINKLSLLGNAIWESRRYSQCVW